MTGIRKFFSFSSAAGIFRVFFLMLADVLCSSVGMFSAILLYCLVQKAPCEFSELLSILPFSCMLLLCNVIFNCYNGSILYPGAGVNKIEAFLLTLTGEYKGQLLTNSNSRDLIDGH